ncbi:MAG: hypothetical protein ACLFV5_02210 [Anaerolineales bacterium]
MQRSKKYIVEGAVLGAVLGMVVGWLYSRRLDDVNDEEVKEIDTKRVMRLVWSGLGLVREIAEL